MADSLQESYEQLPYKSEPMAESHPERLATIGLLAGLQPAPVGRCRVLELGCAQGGNLIAMAEALPESEFVGVDLAPNQIAEGRSMVGELGMKNVRLEAMDLLAVGESFGNFDYVIAHGLLSWVPPEVRKRIFELCHERLTPQGLAYISYNTYPGWRLREVAREGMLYHLGASGESAAGQNAVQQLAQARQFMKVMAEAVDDRTAEQSRLLKAAAKLMVEGPDYYIAHEYLEVWHQPMYFHEFVTQLRGHGLEYVGDARFSKVAEQVAARVAARMPEAAKDPMRFEQYVDFAFGRQFRRSILCRAGLPVQYAMDAARVMECQISANAGPVGFVDFRASVNAEFKGADGIGIMISDSVLKAAMMELLPHVPHSLSFEKLWEKVRGSLGIAGTGESEKNRLAVGLGQLFKLDVVRLSVHPPVFAKTAGEKPVATEMSRWQAARQDMVFTRRHIQVKNLLPLDKKLIPLLDGTRDVAALCSAVGASETEVKVSLQRLASSGVLLA